MWSNKQLKQQLAASIQRAIGAAVGKGELQLESVPDVQLEVPRERAHGDFATNAALALAGSAGIPPRTIAERIVAELNLDSGSIVDAVEIAGPGFINFRLKPGWLEDVVRAVLEEGEAYGNSNYGQGQKVLLEFVSANPTGPLVIANARAAAVGDSLCRIMNAAGYEAASEYYINDAGNQVLNLGKAMEVRCWQLLGEERELPPEAYPGEYVIDTAKKLIEERGSDATRDLLNSPPEQERLRILGQFAVSDILEGQREALSRYGVEFDRWVSEQSIRDANGPQRVVQLLKQQGYTYEDQGAVWFRSTEFGDDKDRVVVKSDGEYTYVVPDAAYHLDKFERGFEQLINLWGPDHHGYIPRLTAALKALGYRGDQLKILIVQWVRLIRDGQVVRMSKRGGDFITMDELLEEVGTDAARFFFLMRSPDTHMDFDLNLATLESNENPVYYVQYAHARIASLLNEAQERGAPMPREGTLRLALLIHEKEDALMRLFAEFPEEVAQAASALEPHRITNYARELATAFHGFYTDCRVLGNDDDLTRARLALCLATQLILQRTLTLLGVSAPEKM